MKSNAELQEVILVTSAVRILSRLPDLCSPKGAINILPSILWLVTGVLKEGNVDNEPFAANLQSYKGIGDSSPKVTAALQALKILVTTEHSRDPRSCEKWTEILQSGLLRVLDLAKTSQNSSATTDITAATESEDPKEASGQEYHDMGLLLAVAIFMLHGPPGSKY